MTADDGVRLLCVVCGKEVVTSRAMLGSKSIRSADGVVIHEANRRRYLVADGIEAGACVNHSADEIRTAFVLVEPTLRKVGA